MQSAYDLPVHRATNDIDFGIVVEAWDEFGWLREALITDEGFQPHPHQQQRLPHEEGARWENDLALKHNDKAIAGLPNGSHLYSSYRKLRAEILKKQAIFKDSH